MQFVLFVVVALVAFVLSLQLRRRYELAQALAAMRINARGLQLGALLASLPATAQTLTEGYQGGL